jgi:hypothetical protein
MPDPEYTPGTPEWIARHEADRDAREAAAALRLLNLGDVDADAIADGELLEWDAVAGKFVRHVPPGVLLARSELSANGTFAAGVAETAANMAAVPNLPALVFDMPSGPVALRVGLPNVTTDLNGVSRAITFTVKDTLGGTVRAQWTDYARATANQGIAFFREQQFDNTDFAAEASVSLTLYAHISAGTDALFSVLYSATADTFLEAIRR